MRQYKIEIINFFDLRNKEINLSLYHMSSSDCCLRKINSACKEVGFNIDELRIREACLSANFEIQVAVNSILNEEQFNLNVISWCVKNNRTLKNISLKRFGKKCNFDSNKIEENGQIFIPINN